MNEKDEVALSILLGVVAAVLLCLGVFIGSNGEESHESIIKHDCGEYNDTTGVWQWKNRSR
jgi:hypothetical protein